MLKLIKSARIQVDPSLPAHSECPFAAQMCSAKNRALETLAKPQAGRSALNPASVTYTRFAENLRSKKEKKRGVLFHPTQ